MQSDVAQALSEAATLLMVGMTVVFLFLSLLIGAIHLIAWVNKRFPEPTSDNLTPIPSRGNISNQDSASISPKVVAAISAAVNQHRRTH